MSIGAATSRINSDLRTARGSDGQTRLRIDPQQTLIYIVEPNTSFSRVTWEGDRFNVCNMTAELPAIVQMR